MRGVEIIGTEDSHGHKFLTSVRELLTTTVYSLPSWISGEQTEIIGSIVRNSENSSGLAKG